MSCRFPDCLEREKVRGPCRLHYRRCYDDKTLEQYAAPAKPFTRSKAVSAPIQAPTFIPSAFSTPASARDAARADLRRRADALDRLDELDETKVLCAEAINACRHLNYADRIKEAVSRALDTEFRAIREELEEVAFGNLPVVPAPVAAPVAAPVTLIGSPVAPVNKAPRRPRTPKITPSVSSLLSPAPPFSAPPTTPDELPF